MMKKMLASAVCGVGLLWLSLSLGIGTVELLGTGVTCKDRELQGLDFFAGIHNGMVSTINYVPGAEMEYASMSVFPTRISVLTKKQKEGNFKIKSVRIGLRHTYEETLSENPEILKQANDILELGRKKFAESRGTACR